MRFVSLIGLISINFWFKKLNQNYMKSKTGQLIETATEYYNSNLRLFLLDNEYWNEMKYELKRIVENPEVR